VGCFLNLSPAALRAAGAETGKCYEELVFVLEESERGFFGGQKFLFSLPSDPLEWVPTRDDSGQEDRMTSVLVVDDHPLMREAMYTVLRDVFADLSHTEAQDFDAALEHLTQKSFDLVLLDLCLPGAGGASGVLRVGEVAPDTPVIVVSHVEDHDVVHQIMACGASGFIPKSHPKDQIASAIRMVMGGGIYLPSEFVRAAGMDQDRVEDDDGQSLTPRQKVVLGLLVRGYSNKLIARDLNISEWTVKAHVSAVLRKLRVTSRVEAVLAATSISDEVASG